MDLHPELRPTAGSLRSDGRQGATPAPRRAARASLRALDCVLSAASVLKLIPRCGSPIVPENFLEKCKLSR